MKYRQGIKKLLSLTVWKQFFKILDKREKITFFIFLLLFLSSSLFLVLNFYFKNTEVKPAKGGTYLEGLVGLPLRINPLYSQENDTDRDLSELIYSGLMKYNETGELIYDLAEEHQIIEDGKIIEFQIKEEVFWSDGKELTVDDIIFTVRAIQNPTLKSHIRASWLGVEMEKISDKIIRFHLRSPSAIFLENCTLKIMPKHIWENISEQNFPFSNYNLEPVGSGPYKIAEIKKDREKIINSLEMVPNQYFHGKKPYISKIIFLFFKNEDELISAFNSKRINGFSLSSSEKYQNLRGKNFSLYSLSLPRYFAVFFNLDFVKEEKIRQALNHAIDKQKIIDQVLPEKARRVDSPILANILGFENPSEEYDFDMERAGLLLDQMNFIQKDDGFRQKITKKTPSFQFKTDLKAGSKGSEVEELQRCLAKAPAGGPEIYPEGEITGYFGEKTKEAVINFQEKYKDDILTPNQMSSGTGSVLASTRKKLNEVCFSISEESESLSFVLTTIDQSLLVEVANLLKESWQELGIEIEIKIVDISEIKEKIKSRNYQMILFGQMLGINPDPFPFWHSSQIRDPGLNLSGYQNEEVDKLLEEARQTLDKEKRKKLLEKFQDILISDAPAIFLYNPDYLFLTSNEVRGILDKIVIDPSKRFANIEDWYIKTKRIKK